MRLRYLSVARLEFREAIAWYRVRSVGAARHFNEEVVVAEKLLAQHPRIGKRVEAEARSLCVNDFPYTLVYLVEKDEILIVAMAHQSRRPGYWKDRLRDGRIGLAKGEFEVSDDIDAHNAEVAARFNGPR